jgi:GNAT superfamily N-acetyltransferase
MTTRYFRYKQATARLYFLDFGLWAVSNVYSQKRGQGHATGVMRQIIDFADQNGIVLKLMIQRYGNPNQKGLDNQQLESFYRGFGFLKDPHQTKPPYVMTRQPSRKIQAP